MKTPEQHSVRFWSKVRKTRGCWIWIGGIAPTGYGRFSIGAKKINAHQFSFGPTPKGKEIDHLCKNRACVNPKHLEAVTHLVNVRRAFNGSENPNTCGHGHPKTKANIYNKPNGSITCRPCNVVAVTKYKKRKKA